MIHKNELKFEDKLIDYLENLGGEKQWEYLPNIRYTEELWENFKHILEKNNADSLNQPLSDTEFSQVKREINNLTTPYKAGKFLYGLGGVSQVEVNLDDGRHVYLTVFDQDQIGAGNTVYQVVKQIKRPAKVTGKPPRRFDVTLLINGLPIIQIEEKAAGHDAREALRQMYQYIDEQQYTDIFSTVQILIAMTPHDVRYMANTTSKSFNLDFSFRWQNEKDNKPVLDWKEFTNQFLSIPMAHQMATNYMILDGTKDKEAIKIMRPYQVYATKRVIEKIRMHDFEMGPQELGYVWHTTGSGKTITSFKTAWLAQRLAKVDKVVFLVDRVALTNQTVDKYNAYDPDGDAKDGVIMDTANIGVLFRRLKEKKNGIIVTSTQKMDRLISQKKDFKYDKNVVFIVDEAHRSTAGDMIQRIKKAFPNSGWVGYTGTPIFDKDIDSKDKEKITTYKIFGEPLHRYTIRDAIKDKNVLGFKVDFETTLSEKVLRNEYLPKYFEEKYPKWTSEQINERIERLPVEEMDDTVTSSVFDMNEKHVQLVVKDVLEKWEKRSCKRRYNALFTTHVGGGKASTPMAMMFYHEFKKQNAKMDNPLKIAVTFSQDTSNGKNQLNTNKSLFEVINDYNVEFGTTYDMQSTKGYTDDVISRLNKTAEDGKYLDLVIVIDQLLTGFDAPELNTLYVDRTLKGANLIQAYSRTNRVHNMQTKPFGRIVNYRWPHHSEVLMNNALEIYANRDSANVQESLVEGVDAEGNNTGIIALSYDEVLNKLKPVVKSLKKLTENFTHVPDKLESEDQMLSHLRTYNNLMSQAKQDDRYDESHPEELLNQIGLNCDDEERLTTVLANDLKEAIANKRNIDPIEISLEMEHIKDVEVNYDYLQELIAQYANQLHNGENKDAEDTREEIDRIVSQIPDRKYASQINGFNDALRAGNITINVYPISPNDVKDLILNNADKGQREEILKFKKKWGLIDIHDSYLLNDMIENHIEGADDMNNSGELKYVIKEASAVYSTDAEDEEIRSKSRIKYRNSLRQAITEFADEIKKKY
nr:HsdR family type I site-specific deoxyribonuclease [uncultured Ligilactobacillus sp.]